MRRKYARWIVRSVSGLAVLTSLSAGIGGCGGGASSVPSGPVRSGVWGTSASSSFPATLQVTASNALLTVACTSPVQLNQPLVLDNTGRFVVTGTFTPCCVPTNHVPTRFEGIVRNNVMTLSLIDEQTGEVLDAETLSYGQNPSMAGVDCPG
jgi:hypothetical protein